MLFPNIKELIIILFNEENIQNQVICRNNKIFPRRQFIFIPSFRWKIYISTISLKISDTLDTLKYPITNSIDTKRKLFVKCIAVKLGKEIILKDSKTDITIGDCIILCQRAKQEWGYTSVEDISLDPIESKLIIELVSIV